jgi:hypothetical protein
VFVARARAAELAEQPTSDPSTYRDVVVPLGSYRPSSLPRVAHEPRTPLCLCCPLYWQRVCLWTRPTEGARLVLGLGERSCRDSPMRVCGDAAAPVNFQACESLAVMLAVRCTSLYFCYLLC